MITPKAVVAKEEEKTILMKGQVVDKGGAPLPGVTVLIEGTTVDVPRILMGSLVFLCLKS